MIVLKKSKERLKEIMNVFDFLLNVPGDSIREGNGIWALNDDLAILNGTWDISYGAFALVSTWNLTKF